MLHLCAGTEVIFAGTLRWLAQLRLADPTRQAAIGDLETVRGEQLLGAHGIAAGLCERRRDPLAAGGNLRRNSWLGLRLGRRLAQNMPHRITRQLEQPADLAQAVALRFQHMHARTDLRRNHGRLTN